MTNRPSHAEGIGLHHRKTLYDRVRTFSGQGRSGGLLSRLADIEMAAEVRAEIADNLPVISEAIRTGFADSLSGNVANPRTRKMPEGRFKSPLEFKEALDESPYYVDGKLKQANVGDSARQIILQAYATMLERALVEVQTKRGREP